MFNHSTFVLVLVIGLMLNFSQTASSRKVNDSDNVFNLLLGLYKVNPLKGSPVFQSFSNDLLLGMGRRNKGSVVMNSESSESVIVNKHVKTNLNEIEKMIHTTHKKPVQNFERPAYDLDDVKSTEHFKAQFVVNDKVISKEEFQRVLLDNHNMKDDFSSLFDHIGSPEAESEMPVTKLLPVKDTITRYPQLTNQNDTVSRLADSKIISRNHIDQLPDIFDRNREENPMNNLVEGMGDVIIF